MRINIQEYLDFIQWGINTAKEVARHDPLNLPTILDDLAKVWRAMTKPWGDLPHGSGIGLALSIGKWISKNPDPLKDARAEMKRVRQAWTI